MSAVMTPKRRNHVGTYRVVPKVSWQKLLNENFNTQGAEEVDWASLYPVKPGKTEEDLDVPVGVMSPRMACKIFYDGLTIIEEADKNHKYMQDRLPEACHKAFKRKQWRKQFMEGCRRMMCRVAKGMGFAPNCIAEDAFIHIILNQTFEFGWRRIDAHTQGLPETSMDRDFNRIARLNASDEVAILYRGADALESSSKNRGKNATKSNAANILDVQSWFKAYEPSADDMMDHFIDN